MITGGAFAAEDLENLPAIGGLLWWGDKVEAHRYAKALACMHGPIIPLITEYPDTAHVMTERHLCIDTTAAGGNATLLLSVFD